MKVLLDIKDHKTNRPISNKTKVLEDVKEAVEELNLIKEGKLIARDAEELFNEL